MSHAVHYRGPEGDQQLEEVPSLEAALALVERLRNEDDASDVRVFREVPIQVRTFYKVVAAEEVGTGSAEPPSGAMPLAPPKPNVRVEPAETEPEAVPSGASTDQRRPLFTRN